MPFFGKDSCYSESCGPGAVGPARQCCRERDSVVQAGNGTAQLGESYGNGSFGFLVFHV